jgi:hypothetical protein
MNNYVLTLLALVATLIFAAPVPAARANDELAALQVAILPAQNADLGPNTLAVPVVLRNVGEGKARNIVITGALNPSAGQLIDIQFTSPNSWVSVLSPDDLEARIPLIEGRSEGASVVTMTLRYTAQPDGPSLINGRLTATWENKIRDGRVVSNPAPSPSGQPSEPAPPPAATISVVVLDNGRRFLFTGGTYSAREQIGVWLNAPDGSVVSLLVRDNRELLLDTEESRREPGTLLPYAEASGQGTISLFFRPTGLAPGSYTFVAQGELSKTLGTAAFQVRE